MDNLNLFLSFKLAGDPTMQVRSATRIEVDGRGKLIVYDAKTGVAERIPVALMNSFQIHNPCRTSLLRRTA